MNYLRFYNMDKFLIWYVIGTIGVLISFLADAKRKGQIEITLMDIFIGSFAGLFGPIFLLLILDDLKFFRKTIFKYSFKKK